MDEERDYGSHLPVLKALLAQHQPKLILELGSGLNSTPAFLSRPEVVRVVSVEPDREWRQIVSEACQDERLVLRPELDVDPSDFDLVFIDDGTNLNHRLETINRVLQPDHPLTVIHDADVPEYLAAIRKAAMNYKIVNTDPPTAVCW